MGQTHRQTDTQTAVTTIHFASSTTHISKRNKPRVKAIVSMSQMCRTIKQVVVGKMLTKYRYSKGKKTGNDDYWKSYWANSWSALAPLDSLVAAQEIKQLVQGTESENTKFKKYTLHKWLRCVVLIVINIDYLLHFAWVVDDAKCIVVTRVCVCVCLFAAVCPHYCTEPDVT